MPERFVVDSLLVAILEVVRKMSAPVEYVVVVPIHTTSSCIIVIHRTNVLIPSKKQRTTRKHLISFILIFYIEAFKIFLL